MPRKRKVTALEGDTEAQGAAPVTPKPKAKRPRKQKSPDPVIEGPPASEIIIHQYMNTVTREQRLKEFVGAPDAKFIDTVKRIRKERLFMIDRNKSVDKHGYVCEKFDIAGSKGNLYKVEVGRLCTCDCMDHRIRKQKCKHINYALIVILKAPVHLQYQAAYLSDELETIFANAPVTRAPVLHKDHDESEKPVYNGSRKPIEGDCPICVDEFKPEEELVWCKAACGQNIHKVCFDQWRSQKEKSWSDLTCCYCRTIWQEDGMTPQKTQAGAESLASLKYTAPKIGSYKNIGHLPMYQPGYQDPQEAEEE